jgi:hypothetical protein
MPTFSGGCVLLRLPATGDRCQRKARRRTRLPPLKRELLAFERQAVNCRDDNERNEMQHRIDNARRDLERELPKNHRGEPIY